MVGLVAERVWGVATVICKEHDVIIWQRSRIKRPCPSVRLVPPHLAISKLVQYLKGKSSYKLLLENQQLSKAFWGRHLWGRGYFAKDNPRNITDEAILEYIKIEDTTESDDGSPSRTSRSWLQPDGNLSAKSR